ncbi:hypothetical protein HNQ91_000030 [Filimonas zeae]|uniref:Rhamnogalacturonase A/B/Epimerase-like pectate lyase domain-containing protein n=1 Tax=Filimonas zeae TaxID=1737353 RepID=A0A917IKX1_9BACT|nr:glycosyl hydrolase family 28-related protein [Filimonas zeae]MDR6337008.1 hypothetical protein [Filimonas zeae]GGH56563.1 hypothetical protein GCM10011379_00290 [Filimonas zeae]
MRVSIVPPANKVVSYAVVTLFTILSGFPIHAQTIKAKAVIIKAISPAAPGETVMLTGDWPQIYKGNSLTGVEVEILPIGKKNATWTRAKVAQLSAHSLKFTIPSNFPMDIFACRIVPAPGASAFTPSDIVYLNQADAWWVQGNNGGFSGIPGGWLRIFGNALYFAQEPKVKITGNGKNYILNAARSKDKGGYAVSVVIPRDIPKGNYTINVNNGLNASSWSQNISLKITSPTVWNSTVYNVKQFQDKNAGTSQEATAALRAALAAAQANGGGIVYFPRGRYIISDMIAIPPNIIIRGEGMGLVNLYWPPRTTALPCLLKGTNDFAVEDITLITSGIHSNIILGLNNVRIERTRIRANAYYRHENSGAANSVSPVSPGSLRGGAAIKLSGNNATITNCDIIHTIHAIELYHTNGGVIAQNTLNYGQGPMQLYGISHVIIEDNIFQGNSLWSGGMGLSLHGASVASYNIYFAHNESRQTFGGDREALTTDGHGTAYLGKVQAARAVSITLKDTPWVAADYTSKDVVTFAELKKAANEKINAATEEYHGLTMYILSGRGTGQYRNVTEIKGKTISIDSAWKVIPDSNSIVSIGKFQGKSLFIGNQFYDAGTSIQLYPPNMDCIVAENQSWRTQSMNCSSSMKTYTVNSNNTQAIRIEPSWYNQFISNHIREGMSWEGSATLGITGNGSLNSIGLKNWRADSPGAMFHVIRSNTLDNNASISIAGDVADIIIEKNNISNVSQGILLKDRSPAAVSNSSPQRIFIGSNTFQKVDVPVSSQ